MTTRAEVQEYEHFVRQDVIDALEESGCDPELMNEVVGQMDDFVYELL